MTQHRNPERRVNVLFIVFWYLVSLALVTGFLYWACGQVCN